MIKEKVDSFRMGGTCACSRPQKGRDEGVIVRDRA